jgi:hypothetical protein
MKTGEIATSSLSAAHRAALNLTLRQPRGFLSVGRVKMQRWSRTSARACSQVPTRTDGTDELTSTTINIHGTSKCRVAALLW